MRVKKVYELMGMDSCFISFTYCRMNVSVNFTGGNTANHLNARYITDNPFIQDAIENDKRFQLGKIRIMQSTVIEDETPEVKQEEKQVEKRRVVRKPSSPIIAEQAAAIASANLEKVEDVRNINDAIAYFAEKGETISDKKDLAALKKKYNVEFPNFK